MRRAFSASHVDRDTQADVELAAEVVLKAAIGFIGNPANPLDWPELAASTVEKKGNDLILLEAGETKASIGKIVGRHWAEIESDNAKAAYAEFGTAKVPSRPFFAPAAAEGASALVLRSHQRVARAFRRTWSRRQR